MLHFGSRRRKIPASEGIQGLNGNVANKNVLWIDSSMLKPFYIFCILGFRLLLAAVPPSLVSWELGWTITHLTHALIQFIYFHWILGTPIWDDQGEYNKYTFWEQLEGPIPWTPTKKFLLVVPILLYLFVCHITNYATSHLIVNSLACVLVIIPKLPEMYRVRLFNFNRAIEEEFVDTPVTPSSR